MRIPVIGYGPIVEGTGEVSGALKRVEPSPGAGGTGAGAAAEAAEARTTLPLGKLEKQLEFLASTGFQTLTVEEFVENRLEGEASTRRVILTFDGGLEAHYRLVLPLLQKFRMRASFFIPDSMLDRPGGLARGELEILVKWGMGVGVLAPPADELLRMLPPRMYDELDRPRRRLAEAIGRPVNTIAIPGRQVETSPLVHTVHDRGYRGLVTMELGNHYIKGDLVIVSRYFVRRTVHPEEWKQVVRMASGGPAKLAFFVRPLK